MINRNSDLKAFQDRVREACGEEFTTPEKFGKAIGLGRDEARRLLKGLPKIGGKYWIDDAVERVFNELHPVPRKAG